MNSTQRGERRSHKQHPYGYTPQRKDYIEDNYEDNDDEEGAGNTYQHIQLTSHSVSEDETQINEILKGLKQKHYEIESYISRKEEEKGGILDDINILTQRLKAINKSLAKKRALYETYDKTLRDSEHAFSKITESTKTLLQVVKKENSSLSKLSHSGKKTL